MRDFGTFIFVTGGAYQGKLDYALSLCVPHPVAVIEGDAIPETWFLSSCEPSCLSELVAISLASTKEKMGEEEADDVVPCAIIVNHVERMARTIRTLSMAPEEAFENLLSKFNRLTRISQLILIADEVGSGVVPLGKELRLDCEYAGRIAVNCASKAPKVVRVLAGIPLIIK